jgi:D-tyrosyl-tRNA(Tyr) deacylase
MRAVIQRVSEASVTIGGEVRGEIGSGFMVLLGIEDGDGDEDGAWLVGKIARLRVFDDSDGNMNLSLADVGGEVLLISQFTLHASTKKGNRPSFIRAARPEVAVPIYEDFIRRLSAEIGREVATGEFGAEMQVALVNDGPVTITIDTKNRE